MLYANAKDTLKKKLPGGDVFGQDMHFADLQDVALNGAVAGDHDAAMKHIMTEAEQMVMLDRLNSCHALAMRMPFVHLMCTCHTPQVLYEDLNAASEAAAGKAHLPTLPHPAPPHPALPALPARPARLPRLPLFRASHDRAHN